MKIRKAVFPVAGLGTRFLPATKATPKEMLPIVDKPLIQYAVEEAIVAGITQIIFVTSSSKSAIENHFDSNFELESTLTNKKKNDLLSLVQNILPSKVNVAYVRQARPLGLGHAVLCAKQLVGNEPFAVLLADDLIYAQKPCLQQMVELFEELNSSILACQPVEQQDTQKYGIVDIPKNTLDYGKYLPISKIIEKPLPETAPSNIASIGRYLLMPEIFNLLEQTESGAGGEIQLVDGIDKLLLSQQVYAYCFNGKRFDCGNKLGYLKATVELGLQHNEVGNEFAKYLKTFICE